MTILHNHEHLWTALLPEGVELIIIHQCTMNYYVLKVHNQIHSLPPSKEAVNGLYVQCQGRQVIRPQVRGVATPGNGILQLQLGLTLSEIIFLCLLYCFPYSLYLLNFIHCLYVLFHSCCFLAQVFRTTLVLELHISHSHLLNGTSFLASKMVLAVTRQYLLRWHIKNKL